MFAAYGPQNVLVLDEETDDAGSAGGHGVLLLPTNLGAKAFEHEDVGRHHHRHIADGHLVLVLMVGDPLEELHQSLAGKFQKLMLVCCHDST